MKQSVLQNANTSSWQSKLQAVSELNCYIFLQPLVHAAHHETCITEPTTVRFHARAIASPLSECFGRPYESRTRTYTTTIATAKPQLRMTGFVLGHL